MKKITRIALTIAIVVAAFVGIGAVLSKNKKENEEKTAVVAQTNSTVLVRVDTVDLKPYEPSFDANGKFAPNQELKYASEISGRVTSVLVDEGSMVRKGQTLAVIKTENLDVDIQTANEVYESALKDKQRFENAYKTGGVTQQQVDQADLNLQNASARLKQAKIKRSDATLKATINGIVNKRLVEPGSVVSPGTQMFEIVDVSKLTIDISVSESQVAFLKNGTAATVEASVLPGKTYKGKVSFIAPKADDNLNFPVKIEVENGKDNSIKAGMYGKASFKLPSSQPSIFVPRDAFLGSVSNNEVYVIKDGKASSRKVVAGQILGDQVEILQGLQQGEIVVTSGQINLSEGREVDIIQ